MNGKTVTLPDLLSKQVSDYIRHQRGQLRRVGRGITEWLRAEHLERMAKDVGSQGNISFAAHLFKQAAMICEPWNPEKAAELRQASEQALRSHQGRQPSTPPPADDSSADNGPDRFEELQTLARYAGFEVEINPTRVVNVITGVRRQARPEGDPIRTYVEQGVGHPHEIVARLCTATW